MLTRSLRIVCLHFLFLTGAVAAAQSSVPASDAPKAERILLPKNIIPLDYKIRIEPNAAKLTFSGHVEIQVQVYQPSATIEINAADLIFEKVRLGSAGEAQVTLDEKKQTALLRFSKPVEPGTQNLVIDYGGVIYKSPSGLFALDYGDAKNAKRALYTQFENSDARRMFPCWDEPNIKATFELSIVVPKSEMVVSNTPIKTETPSGEGLKLVQFARTPKMSTYLVFLATGDFERIQKKVNNVDIGVVVKRGDKAKGQYALEAAAQILPYYEEFFGVKYPLPKLDMVAAPGGSQTFSAMENWGAIFYFDRAILYDPATSTEDHKRYIYLVVAHEMAHQWFGNLVTMDWWDDLWLNEGFATWMESTVTNHFHPEWRPWLDEMASRSGAMGLDAKFGTHPIVQPIMDVLQAYQAFDAITYQKGSAVIRMLEDFVGMENFRSGVRSYMNKYAYTNTVTDDLWKEVEAFSSTTNLTSIAHDFTLQAGVPLIDLRLEKNQWQLSQSRFSEDASTPPERVWQVPVEVKFSQTGKVWKGIVTRDKPVALDIVGPSVVVNPNQTGYYRIRYTQTVFDHLIGQFAGLSPEAQIGMIFDTLELGLAGYSKIDQFFSLYKVVSTHMHPAVLIELAERLAAFDHFYADLPERKQYRAWALAQLEPIFATVGWTPGKNEDANVSLLRASLLQALSTLGHENTIKQAGSHFERFLKNQKSLSAELRGSVLRIVASHANEKLWQQLYTLAQKAESVVEKQEFYNLLGVSDDPKLMQMALDLFFNTTTPQTIRPDLIVTVGRRMPKLAFDFTFKNHDAVLAALESGGRDRFIGRFVGNSFDRSLVDRIDDYARQYISSSSTQSVDKIKASIRFNADIREKRIPEITSWLKTQTGASSFH